MLEVFVKSAELFGRRSQDPYALVYLLDKKDEGERHAKTWFQEKNNQELNMKTKTRDKTLNPEWNHPFRFAGGNDLEKKSLVIAIWDKDSRSDDDYMAGVRIPLAEVSLQSVHVYIHCTPKPVFYRWTASVMRSEISSPWNSNLRCLMDT